MAFIPSTLQQNFFDWISTGRGSAVLVAVAGSGKTTTVIEGLPLIPESAHVQLLAFNKTIGDELKSRVASLGMRTGRKFANVKAGTFHSLALGALKKKLGKFPQIDGRKLQKLTAEFMNEEELDLYGAFVCKLVGLARGEGIGCLTPDLPEAWWNLISHHDLTLDTEDASEEIAIDLARKLLARSEIVAKRDAVIDFDDMLYLPVKWGLKLWQNDWVFVDESQDTNPVRRALIKMALRPGGRLVAVGDPRQAIYGFTGASHDAIDLIKSQFNAIELPLTVSYRCARAVVEAAQAIVPYIQSHESAPEGRVESLPLSDALKVLTASDAVLCRQTAPLVKLAYSLIGQGRGCIVLGRDIGAGLANLVKKQKARTVDILMDRLTMFRDREVAKFTAKGEEAKAEAVVDRVECIDTIVGFLPENGRTIPALLTKIDQMFNDQASGVLTLCTVHKAKGKEWNRVAILRPDLMPSKWARQEWQALQEQNLIYVAYTRAKEHLMLLTSE